MGMSELGAYLTRHREEQGLSLEDVEEQTRIRVKYLKYMEAGEWDELPPGVYTRGLLRNFARAVGVSPASVLRMYIKERPSEARLPEPQLISQPLIRQPRFNLELLAAFGLLIIAVGLFAWMVGTQLWPELQDVARQRPGTRIGLAADAPTAELPPATSAATATRDRRPAGTTVPIATPTGRPTSTGASEAADDSSATDAKDATDATDATVATDAEETSDDSSAAVASGGPGLELEVEATSDAWLMVQTDGQDAFMGFLRKGESRRWMAKESVRLKTGNAGGTQVTLNGQPLPALGGSGDVETREWRLMPNGDIEQSS